MRSFLTRLAPRGPTLLALGVLLGLAFPALAECARPLMPVTIFLIVLGTLLRIDVEAVIAALKRPSLSVFLPAMVMVASPALAGAAGHLLGLDRALALALVLAVSAPPSSGTTAVARMLGLDGAAPLVVTFLSMALAPVTAPLLAGWFGGLQLNPLDLALRLALLIGGAEGVALVLRRRAAKVLARRGAIVDGVIVAALLIFALAAMAGVRTQIAGDPGAAIVCLALAFACNLALQAGGALLLPGSLRERLTVGLILGNRNVGLVWSALGAAANPRMALYFAATQLPIYTLPRLIAMAIAWSESQSRRKPQGCAKPPLERDADDNPQPHA
jgi:BASS family bile acid:Na+ symporter